MTTTQATEPMADEQAVSQAVQRDGSAVPESNLTDAEAAESELPMRASLEAVLMVADQPLDHLLLAQAVGAPPADVAEALQALAAEYTEQGRGFDLRNTGGGWRFYSRGEFASVVEQFVVDGQQARLTQAALETLAVIAYREPVSRARVSAIRGVNVDSVVRTLVSRGLVDEAGTDSETGAHLYRTTSYFLERMGLTSLDELPEIAPFLPEMGDMEGEFEEFASGVAEPVPSTDPGAQGGTAEVSRDAPAPATDPLRE